QPSDPESAALPLRHSPSRFRSEAGRLILGTCRRPAALLLGDDDVRFLARSLRTNGHPDRQRLLFAHEAAESVLHKRFRSVEVHCPAHPENAITEQMIGIQIPVRVTESQPGRWP